MFTLMDEYDTLPDVSDIPSITADLYYKKANALKKFCKPEILEDSATEAFPKFGEWCSYIKRFTTCEIAPHPSEFMT